MPESKFLKWQDIDGDGVIDICDDVIETPRIPECKPCVPNPTVIVPDWKKRDITEPFLNNKICHYQVTVVTRYTNVVSEEYLALEDSDPAAVNAALKTRWKEYEGRAAVAILDKFNKDDSLESINIVRDAIMHYQYYLDPRPYSRLMFLYSVPFDVIYNIPDRGDSPPDEETADEEGPGIVRVMYDAGAMTYKNIRVRKALWLYSQYLKVYRALDEGNIFFVGDNPPQDMKYLEDPSIIYPPGNNGAQGRLFNLADYGDPAVFTSSTMSDLMDSLEEFLNSRGYNIPGVGSIFVWGLDIVTKLEFTFDEYKLIKLKVWSEECGPKPTVYGKKRLSALNAKGAWKDKTACAYFAQLWPMEASLSARIPLPWTEFIEKFTYPKVKADFDSEKEKPNTPLSCVADNLNEELKQLGEDLLDDMFGIGDAIAYKFNQNICRFNTDEVQDDSVQMGQVLDPTANEKGNIFAMAQTQAYRKLMQDDQIFTQMCARVLANATGLQSAQKAMDKLYSEGFERIKMCGMFDMLMAAIECLLGGMTLEEALNGILRAALENMSIENFGDLFVGLPPSKQAELDALVKQKMQSGTLINVDIPKPWENQALIDEERTTVKEGPGEGMTPDGSATATYAQANQSSQGRTSRTLAHEYDMNAAQTEAAPDTILSLYVEALLEHYSQNLLELMDELNKFPGSQLIAHLIIAMDCPRPPLFNPSFMSWIKNIQLPFCRDISDMRAPRLDNPFKWIPSLRNILKYLWEAIKWAIQQAIMTMLIRIFVKICELIGDAICKALETFGDIAMSMPAIMSGRTTFSEVIKDSLCGPTASPEQIEETVLDLMNSMGVGGAALGNRTQVLQFTEDLASTATRAELADAFLGNPSQDFLRVVDQLIEFEHPEFRDALPNTRSIGRMMKNIGNLMPLDFRAGLEDLVAGLPTGDEMPANPSLCASPEQLENFKNLRCELLEGRATKEQCDVMYDEMRNGFVQDLGDISNLMQGGLQKYMSDNLPPMVSSSPDCNDGIFPFESPQQIQVHGVTSGMAMESLRISYAKDMMGNGGFLTGDGSWGLMNMALSDTQGNPLTAHWRKSKNSKSYVNFATNVPNGGESTSGFFSFFQSNASFTSQHGQFPVYVGEWLMRQFQNASVFDRSKAGNKYVYGSSRHGKAPRSAFQHQSTAPYDGALDMQSFFKFDSHNGIKPDRNIRIKWEDMDFNMFWGQGVDTLILPDFGYNSPMRVDFSNERIIVTQKARKGMNRNGGGNHSYIATDGDMNLVYHDNAAGMRDGCGLGSNIGMQQGDRKDGGLFGMAGSQWSYGYNVQVYFSDIAEIQEPIYTKRKKGEKIREGTIMDKDGFIFRGYRDTGVIANRADDNVRVKITDLVNVDSEVESPLAENATEDFMKTELIDLPNWIEHVPLLGGLLQAAINLITMPFSFLFLPSSVNGRSSGKGVSVWTNRKMEFLTVDDGLDGFEMDEVGPIPNEKSIKVLKWDSYPKTRNCFTGHQDKLPQVVMLEEIISKAGGTASNVKQTYDEIMNELYKMYAGEIAQNSRAWQYGADYDTLQKSDLDYCIGPGHRDRFGTELDPYTPYNAASVVKDVSIWTGEEYWRTPEDDDMILGVSRDQLNNGDNARVIYLNPSQFGGDYSNPPLHIKQQKYKGWMGLIQVWFPEMSPCKPSLTELVDFGEIKERISEMYPKIPEDKRLKQDEDCAFELPYNRILSRTAKAGLAGVIEASIRIYASTHFLKAIPTFSLVTPKMPQNFSSIYSAYVVEHMEAGFKDAQSAFWEYFSTFKDEEFWYAFLEMSVQYYGWLVDNEEIVDPPPSVIKALNRLNNHQETYDFPWLEDLWAAKMTGDAGTLETLSSYRSNKNLEFVRATEEDAKLILKELVSREMTYMGDRLLKNLRHAGFDPKIWDLDWHLLMTQTAGSRLTVHSPEMTEIPVGIPGPDSITPVDVETFGAAWPGPYYTYGGEFVIGDSRDPESGLELGDPYVGYYHGHIDETGSPVYMAGEMHTDAPHDKLIPMSTKVQIGTKLRGVQTKILAGDPSGKAGPARAVPTNEATDSPEPYPSGVRSGTSDSVAEEDFMPNKYATVTTPDEAVPFGDVIDYDSEFTETNKMFGIKKYVSVNGTKMSHSAAKAMVQAYPGGDNLSDHFRGPTGIFGPGRKSIKTVRNSKGEVTGVTGQMGVRYGIEFYFNTSYHPTSGGSTYAAVTSVEVNALDLPISQFQPFEGSSKLLWCLIYLLKNDPIYKLVVRYIFPIPKILSTLAIYNDMGFLSAIGEVTVGKGDYDQFAPLVNTTGPSNLMGKFLNLILRNGSKKVEWIPKNQSGSEKDGTSSGGYAKNGIRPGWEKVSSGGNSDDTYGEGDGRSWAVRSKPGRIAFIDFTEYTKEYEPNNTGTTWLQDFLFGTDDPVEVNVKFVNDYDMTGNEGWQHYDDRQPGWFNFDAWFVTEWDSWDRKLLRNSNSRLKQQFRSYYYGRNFTPGDHNGESPGMQYIKNLRGCLLPVPGGGMLPWWQRGRLRSNPYNADGKLCTKND